MAWKYIVVRRKFGHSVIEFPLIFPDKMVHADMAAMFGAVGPIGDGIEGRVQKVVSAGKIEHITVLGLGGESETLQIESRQLEDVNVIENYSYGHGIV